jgi:hypothetical protein
MKTKHDVLHKLSKLAIGLACVSIVQTAAAEEWAVDVNPSNGFGGVTDLWDISLAGTFYADWDIFGSLADDSPNFSFGLGTASVTETGGQAFITGGGNIYSFAAVTSFTTTLSTGEGAIEGTRTVVARFKTLGTALADDSVLLSVNGTQYAPSSSQLLYNLALGGFGGNDQEKIFVWTVPDGDYTFTFNSAESSMSLARYATYASDVTPIPEPSTCVLLGISTGVVLFMVRRRRRVEFGDANA